MRTKKRAFPLKGLLALLIIALGLTLTACFGDDEGTTTTGTTTTGTTTTGTGGGSTASIMLAADDDGIPAGGTSSTTITATLTDVSGQAVAVGTSVTFTTTLGSFPGGTTSYTVATSGNSGIVNVSLMSSATAGAAMVTAASNNVTQTVPVEFTAVGATTQVGSVILAATSITGAVADGNASYTITAQVRDTSGQPLSDQWVTFSSSGHSGLVAINPTTAITAADGTVSSKVRDYYYSILNDTVDISASAGSATSSTITLTFIGTGGGPVAGQTAAITLTADPESIRANGSSSSSIKATLTDSTGGAVAEGTTVAFSTDRGTFPGGTASLIVSTPNASGVVTVSLIADTAAGTATITATSYSVTQTVSVELTEQPGITVGSVTLTAGSSSIVANGTSNTLITATVKDPEGYNIADLTPINFTNIGGGSLSAASPTTTNGKATVTLTSSTNVGSATVTATVGGVSDTASVSFIPGPVSVISLTASPSNLTADGSSKSTINALVTDAQSNAVSDGETISFSVTTGTGTIYPFTATTTNGIATVAYTASDTAGTETVTAEAANYTSNSIDINLINVQVGSIKVEPSDTELIADGISTTMITATVKDGSGKAVPDGTLVTFTNNTAYGILSAASAQTIAGSTSVMLTSLNNQTGARVPAGSTAVIKVSCGGLISSATISFIPGSAYAIIAEANPQTIPAEFMYCPDDSSRIIASVQDMYGNNVADGTEVVFSIDKGWIWDTYPLCPTSGPLPITTSKTIPTANGAAKIAIIGGGSVETGTVDICVGGLCYKDATGTPGLKISFGGTVGEASGLPASIQLSISSSSIQVKGTGGTETATITAKVYDESGNPITDTYTSGDGSTTVSAVFTSASAQFQTRGFKSGDTLTINTGDDNGTYTIVSVDNETEVTLNQAMTATDSDLTFTATVKNNITFSILQGPGGGENIDGETAVPSTSTKSTINGQASATLNSGTCPGGVTIQVQCSQGGKTATATSSEVGIESGPPANVAIYTAPTVEDNLDGTISWIISALVQDRYGNPVANDTALHFGLVDNQVAGMGLGYKTTNTDGVATGGNDAFSSAGAGFVTNDVVDGDSLIITEVGSKVRGGYIIESVDGENTLTLYRDMSFDDTGLEFYAGNAELGVVCGVVQTGNSEPTPLCYYDSSGGIKGIAHTRLTWGATAIWKPFYLYAATSGEGGQNLGMTLVDSYPGVAPVTIEVTIIPSEVTQGYTGIDVYAHLKDGSVPPHYIADQQLTFATSNSAITGFGAVGNATTTAFTDNYGVAYVNLDTGGAALPPGTSEKVTITVSILSYAGEGELTITTP